MGNSYCMGNVVVITNVRFNANYAMQQHHQFSAST